MLVKCCCEVHPPLWLKFVFCLFSSKNDTPCCRELSASSLHKLLMSCLCCCYSAAVDSSYKRLFPCLCALKCKFLQREWQMRRTVRGLCWCLEGRALWRRRKQQYSPPFWCKLGPKTPTFQQCQHHIARYCRTPPKILWACSNGVRAASWLIPHLRVHVDVTLWLPTCWTLERFFIGFRLQKDLLSCHGGKRTGASNTAAL